MKYLEQFFDYLPEYGHLLNIEEIKAIRRQKLYSLKQDKFKKFHILLERLEFFPVKHLRIDHAVVEIGTSNELTEEQGLLFKQALQLYIPWKKGPFKLFDTEIDAEWRSDVKWQRINHHCNSIDGKVVADIGCHNGYFMFRMAAERPKLVIGFEPVEKHFLNYQLLQNYARIPGLHFEMLGVEHIDFYPNFFDSIFCLGILYHHSDPIGLLRKIWHSLKPDGQLIIDCQGIEGKEPNVLFPSGRYAKARGNWFLPTISALENWLSRTQFCRIQCIYNEFLEPSEQRSTKWAPIDSLEDFLDPTDQRKTIEGYPAPKRFYMIAYKP